jgi:5-(carboxyamino)imidazole ribonucleotide synthase
VDVKNSPILPGAALGVLGSGQLGRMFAIAAREMGYRVHTLSHEDDTPTGQVADLEINASYEDVSAVGKFAQGVQVVTFEFENVPAATAEAAARFAPVRPAGDVLHTTQHRLREKTFLAKHGFPHAPFVAVRSLDDLRGAVAKLGLPAVLKTAGWGYDGKGQIMLTYPEQLDSAWARLATGEAVLEGFIDFECEVSVVAARGADGSFTHWGVIENDHHNHILDVSLAPARVTSDVHHHAMVIARAVLEQLNVVGVLCVEFFLTERGDLLINELAPRPHNSGHLTIDACATSQFQQQVRAVCDLPLGDTRQHAPAAMANLLGDLWETGEPNWPAALAVPGVKLHLYGKHAPRPGRKMGHLTALADDVEEARRRVIEARARLTSSC